MKAFPWIAALFVMTLTACVAHRIPKTLSPVEKEAFVVLRDQLKQLAPTKSGLERLLCTSVAIDGAIQAKSERLLNALREARPANLNVTLIDGATCTTNSFGEAIGPDGRRALSFFADRAYDKGEHAPAWTAGWMCGNLCGSGETYRIEIQGGEPVPIILTSWTS